MSSKQFVDAIQGLSNEDREQLYDFSLEALRHAHTKSLKYPDMRKKGQFLMTVATEFMTKNKQARPPSPPSTKKGQICPITKVYMQDGVICCRDHKDSPDRKLDRAAGVIIRAPESQHESIRQELDILMGAFKVADLKSMGPLGVEILEKADLINRETRRTYQAEMLQLLAQAFITRRRA